MKTVTISMVLLVCLLPGAALASPSLLVTKPPLDPRPDATNGPPHDPIALQGQWFEDHTVRTHEFYDNLPGYGGTSSGSAVIRGKVSQIEWDGAAIRGFTIHARIFNQAALPDGAWRDGYNSHYGENLHTEEYYTGKLYDTMLTASFAVRMIDEQPMLPTQVIGPYRNTSPKIYAVNEDMGAWYCYCPGTYEPSGDYFVPAWDFGDIGPGGSKERDLQFGVTGVGLVAGDSHYDAVMYSSLHSMPEADIFSNRTTGLKISEWIDDLLIDEGIAYPSLDTPEPVYRDYRWLYDPLNNSDVSVFHNIPEPATLAMLALGGLPVVRRRRG